MPPEATAEDSRITKEPQDISVPSAQNQTETEQEQENPALPEEPEVTTGAGQPGTDTDADDSLAPSDETDRGDQTSETPSEEETVTPPIAESDTLKTDAQDDQDARMDPLATNAYPTPLKAGRYTIRSSISDTRVIDIANAGKSSGTNVQIWPSNMTGAQLFDVAYDNQGYYTIKNVNSGLLLDVSGGAKKAGTNVHQYKSNGTAAQKWVFTKLSDGSYKVASALSNNLVLDVSGASNADGANVQVYTANGTKAQSFVFIPSQADVTSSATIESGRYTITSKLSSSLILDVPSASMSQGTQMQIYTANNTFAQVFEIRAQADGLYAIRTVNSGHYLGVNQNNVVAGTPVVQLSATQDTGQRWALTTNSDGSYTFISKRNGLALDITGGANKAGTKIQVWYSNSTAAQRFTLKAAPKDPLVEGIYTIAPTKKTDKCIDIAGGSRENNINVQAYTSNGTLAQKFQVIRVDTQIYTFQCLNSGLYLTATKGNVVQQSAPSEGVDDTQKWRAEWITGGFTLINVATGEAMTLTSGGTDGHDIRTAPVKGDLTQAFRYQATPVLPMETYIISVPSGKVVDSTDGATTRNTNTQIWTDNNSAAQKWQFVAVSGDYFSIRCVRSQRALDIAGGSTATGANVRLWDYNGSNAQLWRALPSGDGWFYLQSKSGMYLAVDGDGQNVSVTGTVSGAQKFRFKVTQYSLSGNARLDSILNTIMERLGRDGDVLRKSFNHVISYPYRIGSVSPTGEWSVPFAIEMYDYGSGNCYRHAALFCWLAKANGYDARAISGYVPRIGGGLAPHAWVEIRLNGQTYVCDPNFGREYPTRNWYMVTYTNAPITYTKW